MQESSKLKEKVNFSTQKGNSDSEACLSDMEKWRITLSVECWLGFPAAPAPLDTAKAISEVCPSK